MRPFPSRLVGIERERATPRERGRGGPGWRVIAPALVLAVLAATVGSAEEARRPQLPELKVRQYRLPNGLTVLLHEDHTTPVAAVDLYYKVGSKDERPAKTGFAHLFEHMMFLGSEHHDADYSLPLEQVGAETNATTDEDRTEYYERVPSNALERALWLEADRLGFLLPAMTRKKLDSERDVVKNERRERVDNVPYGRADEAIREALYPPDHPYRHSVIGSMADLSAASLEDVAAFFRDYYTPDNAILCVAGDIDRAKVETWIGQYFGAIPRNAHEKERHRPDPKSGVPVLDQPKRLRLTDAVSLARVQIVWPTVPQGHPDEPALDVLAAVLGGLDKENRLFRALMFDRSLAAEVSASHPTRLLSGEFDVTMLAHPGGDLAPLVKLADAEIDRLKTEGPTEAEVRKAQNQRESDLILGLQSILRRAQVFNLYEATRGDPTAYRAELDRVFAVTTEDVRRVARKYLGPNRVELEMIPGASAPAAVEAPASSPAGKVEAPPAPAIGQGTVHPPMPELGPTPRFRPPHFEHRRLSNGLELRIVERHELPIVTIDLIVKSGETLTPAGKEGLASLAAELLTSGTTTLSTIQLAGALAEIGASIDSDGGLESTTVGLTTLSRHLDRGLDLFADVVRNPAFEARELERLRLERLSQLSAIADDAEETSHLLFPRLIYGSQHPYGRPILGTPASVKSITRDDISAFCRRIMVPGNAAVVVVGDVRPDAIAGALDVRFRGWGPGPIPAEPTSEKPPSPPDGRPIFLIDRPGAPQSVIAIGRVAAARKSPDYHAILAMNAILGGQFASRINLKLRQEKGYSYGAESGFGFYREPGPFVAGGPVESSVTKEALVEFFHELSGIVGPRPVTEEELAFAKERLLLGFPSRFETTFGVAGQLAVLVADDLPDDEFERYQPRIEALTRADVDRVAHRYITPDNMVVLIVGDRARIEGPIQTLPWARSIQHLNAAGHPLDRPFDERR